MSTGTRWTIDGRAQKPADSFHKWRGNAGLLTGGQTHGKHFTSYLKKTWKQNCTQPKWT